MFVCIRSSLHSVHFGQLLRCAHKRIVNVKKVYIERNNNKQVELIRFRKKNSDFIDVGNFEVGIYFCDRARQAHCYPSATRTVLVRGGGGRARRTFRDMTTSVHAISGQIQFGTQSLRDMPNSGHSHFGTCHIETSTIRDCTTALFQVTMYRQFALKVGPSAN